MNRRKLTLEIDAATTKEMIYSLRKVIDRLTNHCGDCFQRFETLGTHIEMTLETYGEEMEYRIEEINGKKCQIYRSKL